MKEIIIRINFLWDDEDDIWKFKLSVPESATIEEVTETIIREHNFLSGDDDTDVYGNLGRNPTTLLDYVCRKYNWEWFDMVYDIDIKLD